MRESMGIIFDELCLDINLRAREDPDLMLDGAGGNIIICEAAF